MSDIKTPINGHTDRATWNWLDNLLIQPSTGTGSGITPATNIHYKISLSKLQALIVSTETVVNNLTTIDPGYVADARQLTALKALIDTLNGKIGAVSGIATLGADGKIPNAQIPALAIVDVFPVATEAAMLALGAEQGDMAIRSDTSQVFILQASPATTLGNWLELSILQAIAGLKIDKTAIASAFQATPDDVHVPSEKLVADQLAFKADKSSLATEVSRAVTSEQQIGETLSQTFSRLMALAAQVNDSVNMYQLSAIHKVGVGYKVADNSAYDVSSTRVDGSLDVTVKGVTVTQSVENGDFSDGTTGWDPLHAILAVNNGNLRVTGTDIDIRALQLGTFIEGHAYFLLANVRVNSADISSINLDYVTVGTSNVAIKTSPISGTIYALSGIITAPTGTTRIVQIRMNTAGTIECSFDIIGGADGVRIFDLTASGLAHLTADQCSAQFPYFSGTKSVPPMEILVKGKNQLKEPKILTDFDVNSGPVLLATYYDYIYMSASGNYGRIRKKLTLKPSTQYTVSVDGFGTGFKTVRVTTGHELDGTSLGAVTLGTTRGISTFTFTSPYDGLCTLQYFVADSVAGSETIYSTMIESGSTATAYAPYKEDIATTPVPLRSVPAIQDTYGITSGRHVRNVEYKQLDGTETISSDTSYTNTYLFKFTMTGVNQLGDTSIVLELNGIRWACLGSFDDNEHYYHYISGSTSQIRLWITKATVDAYTGADVLTKFKAFLLATNSWWLYQLATPVITAYTPQLLTAGVHLQQTPYFYEVLITDALGQIYLDYPLGTMKRITLIEGGLSDDAPVYTTPDTTTIDFTGKAGNLVAIVEYYISTDYPNPRLEYYTPISNTATRLTSLEGYGEIYAHDNVAVEVLPTGATYTKIINFGVNGISNLATPDYVNNKITLPIGKYRVSFSASFSCGTNNTTVTCSAFLAGVEQNQIHFKRKIATGGDIGSASISGIVNVAVASDLDVRMRHNIGASVNLTATYMNLNVQRIG